MKDGFQQVYRLSEDSTMANKHLQKHFEKVKETRWTKVQSNIQANRKSQTPI